MGRPRSNSEATVPTLHGIGVRIPTDSAPVAPIRAARTPSPSGRRRHSDICPDIDGVTASRPMSQLLLTTERRIGPDEFVQMLVRRSSADRGNTRQRRVDQRPVCLLTYSHR